MKAVLLILAAVFSTQAASAFEGGCTQLRASDLKRQIEGRTTSELCEMALACEQEGLQAAAIATSPVDENSMDAILTAMELKTASMTANSNAGLLYMTVNDRLRAGEPRPDSCRF
jgi:hypothetical protein